MDHLARVQKAVDFVEEHLNGEITTEDVAKVAGFSLWHFQVIFSAAVGDTLKEYVRKRRLTAAAVALAESEDRIIDIALASGFESQEAFTRAFKALFQLTPGEYRSSGARPRAAQAKPKITLEYLNHLYGGLNMQPKFETRSESRVVGMSAPFISILSPERNNFEVIPRLWNEYMKRSDEIKSRKSWADIGVCMCLPNHMVKSHPDECLYIAGTEVSNEPSSAETTPTGMTAMTIPAGEYAVFTHKGKLDKLSHTMNYIYGSWLPKSGRELRDAPDLEIYGPKFNPASDDSELEIYIPVK